MLKLALRGLRFHWRSHTGLFIGAALATAILVGALAVGDAVRQSLREMALTRIGSLHLALNGQSRFIRDGLAKSIAEELKADATPVMLLRGTASVQREAGEARSGRIQVTGVSPEFWRIASASPKSVPLGENSVAVNRSLADRLALKVGEDLLLRIEKPSLLSRDAPLSTVEDSAVPLRLRVSAVVEDRHGGRFSLAANQVPPLTAYVSLDVLQRKVAMAGRTNAILVGGPPDARLTPEAATQALWKHWDFADAGLELKPVLGGKKVELRTDRVFLDPPVSEAAIHAQPGAEGVLTYFVNELRVGGRATPYSVVSGLQGGPAPDDLGEGEALINEWLAADLKAKPGDTLKLSYWVVGPKRRLVTESSEFRIRGIVPLKGVALDPDLMPNIPGLSDKKNCREWEPGVPVDLEKIRDKDQDYWSKYRGTPKAFITLGAAQKIWKNRFGNLTAVRYPTSQGVDAGKVALCIRQALNPASLGIHFDPVREQALAATGTALDFGHLFLGFSFFLVIASLLLTALLFGLAIEQRSEEIGALLAMGFRPTAVRKMLLLEALAPMLLAAALGSLLGILYTRLIVLGLNSIWGGAVAGAKLVYAAEPRTILTGALSGLLTALISSWIVLRRQARGPIRELLTAGAEADLRVTAAPRRGSRVLPGFPTAIVTLVLGFGALAAAASASHSDAAGYFFMGGALLLISGIAGCRALLAYLARRASGGALTIASLGTRGAARRVGRSLAAVALLACGSFMVIAVGANRHDPLAGAEMRSSGTGGFRLYGETTMPIYSDLNSPAGQEDYALDEQELSPAKIVQMRLRDGDEASCLNLNRAQVPRLVGVSPEEFRSRGAFTFGSLSDRSLAKDPWRSLEVQPSDGAIPAVGDMNTIVWSLGKKLGDVVNYVDERGNARKLRIVGILGNSVLQGSLIVNEADFIQMFPTLSGYQAFLIDAPKSASAAVQAELVRGLEDQGIDLRPAADRLASFSAVEETYLSIFAALGGLGLLLGSAGLGVILLRNVLERRGELALLRAVGFRNPLLQRLIFSEHSLLLVLGLAVGVIAAVAAVVPTVTGVGFAPVISVAVILIGVLLSGLLWTLLATVAALRGPLMSALRNE